MTNGAKYIGNDRKEYEFMVKKINNWRAGTDRLNMQSRIIRRAGIDRLNMKLSIIGKAGFDLPNMKL